MRSNDSYNKSDKSSSEKVWRKLLEKFSPYSGFEVEDYYGISLIKKKKGGVYSIKLIHDYQSNAMFSSAYEVEDLQKVIKIIEILEWFAKDDLLRPNKDVGDIDLDASDEEINEADMSF